MDQSKHIQEEEAAGLLWFWGNHRGLCGLPHQCIVTPKFIRQNSPNLSTRKKKQCRLLHRLPYTIAKGSNWLQGPCSHKLDRTRPSPL